MTDCSNRDLELRYSTTAGGGGVERRIFRILLRVGPIKTAPEYSQIPVLYYCYTREQKHKEGVHSMLPQRCDAVSDT